MSSYLDCPKTNYNLKFLIERYIWDAKARRPAEGLVVTDKTNLNLGWFELCPLCGKYQLTRIGWTQYQNLLANNKRTMSNTPPDDDLIKVTEYATGYSEIREVKTKASTPLREKDEITERQFNWIPKKEKGKKQEKGEE